MVGLPYRNGGSQTITAVSNDKITTHTSTSARIPNYGKTLLSATTTSAAPVYVMEAPVPGVRKVLVQTSATTTVTRTVTGPTTTTFFANATATNTNLVFAKVGDLIELEGRTSLIWDVVVTNGATLS